ncbi:LysR family transcriptional regulator [Oricola thermophila]|uniref:LysR family transcriptional regulator n=1 Tax=Oricola thermophila TaxID=2742145 RepID=A0A6N1V9F5_9HYPH|nr:LysR family transcriptional regulator [Oricola thermophila]QKV17153.1 LysR family transcriptional regulator [Oricola thermophila]
MDRLDVMRAYCRVVERMSITKAADDMGLSPALVSKHIKLLENGLGCVLLARTTRSMSLTEHGRHYYDECRRLLGEIDALDNAMREEIAAPKGRLRVNAPLSYSLVVLAPLLPRFMEAFPDIELVLDLDDRVLNVVEEGYDISIRVRAELPDSSLVVRPLGEIRQHVCASPDYIARRGEPAVPADLAEHNIVGYGLADAAASWTFDGPGGTETFSPRPRLTVGNSLFLRDMLRHGAGIGSLPSFIASPCFADGSLRPVLEDYRLPDRRIFAVTPTRRGIDARTRVFLDFLRQNLAG